MKAIDINGVITTYDQIPNIWNDILNYDSVNNTAMQIDDGWRDVVIPNYDIATQKLGDLYLDEPNYTYEIIALTPEEIAIQKAIDREGVAEDSFNKGIEDGNALFSKSYRRMYRRFLDDDVAPNNILTLDDVKKYMNWNLGCYTSLNQGDYYSAEDYILQTLIDHSVELSNNRPLEKMFEWLRDQIQDYILNIYDLK